LEDEKMKKNNKISKIAKSKTAKPRSTGKAKILAVLMFFSAVLGWAREQVAVVLRHLDTNDGNTEIFLDKDGDGRPDLRISLGGGNLLDLLLKDELAVGTTISYEDNREQRSLSLPYVFASALISIEGQNILELFDQPGYFTAAAERRRTGR
jgi:hypothetical protein